MEIKYVSHLTVQELRSELRQLLQDFVHVTSPEPQVKDENMTRKEVAQHLKITLPTLHEWTKNKTLTAHKINGRVYYKKGDIEQLFKRIDIIKHRKGNLPGY